LVEKIARGLRHFPRGLHGGHLGICIKKQLEDRPMMNTTPNVSRRALTWIVFWTLLVGGASTTTVVSAGEMYRWMDEQGRIHLTDTPPRSNGGRHDLKVYKPSMTSPQSEPSDVPPAEAGGARLTPMKPGGVVMVEAVLNRRLTVPLMLDTGADFTVLPKQVAEALRISALEHLPKMELRTAGGAVNFPITTLRSLRVGDAEARDVAVAIDMDGHMPVGLLGMTFLRHFKVTIDQQRGQVKFER
jgi:clan AA aspartic protease (TIGR02281 family)